MEVKNEQQKQKLIYVFLTLFLIIICSLLFIQNRKIERIMAFANANYNRYGIPFEVYQRPNNDIYIIEQKINERFLEFAREMEELKYIIKNITNNDYEDYITKISNKVEESKKRKTSKKKKENKVKNQEKNNEKSKNKRNKDNKNNHNNNQFEVETDYDEDEKEYEVEIKLPNDFNMDDISVTLKNSILSIKIEKEFKNEDKKGEYYKYGSFYQSFTIPKTKATTKDIKKNLENGKLEIKVPIK